MDAAEALADLKQISAQIDRAVVVRNDGTVAGSTLARRRRRRAHRAAPAATLGGRRPARAATSAARRSRSSRWRRREGSVFAVRDEARMIVRRRPPPDPTVGLIFYDLKTCLRNIARGAREAARREPAAAAEGGTTDGEGVRSAAFAVAIGSVRRLRAPAPPPAAAASTRVDLYFDDGSMLSLRRGRARGRSAILPARRRGPRGRRPRDRRSAGPRRVRERALLEGDFLLRSGRRSPLLPRQVPLRDPTRPAGRIGDGAGASAIARASSRDADALAGARARRGARSPPPPAWRTACRS